MFAKEIMTTAVVTCKPDSSVMDVMKLLIEIELTGLVVLNDEHEVVGVVTGKDVLVAYDFMQNISGSIENFYNKTVISVKADTPVEDVSRILFENNIHRVPVVDNKKLLGVVSRRDILKYIMKKCKNAE